MKDLLPELNYYRKRLGMKPVKRRPNTDAAIAESLLVLARRVTMQYPNDKKALGRLTQKLPSVVAEGAYANNREAVAKTAHTTNGKTQSQIKQETRMAKAVAKATKAPAAAKAVPAKKPANDETRTRSLEEHEMSLAQIAEHIKVEPKNARAKARKNAAAIGKFEVKGKKYVFNRKDRDKVAAIIKG